MSSILDDFWPKKWPTKKQWKRSADTLNIKERVLFSLLILFTILSFGYGVNNLYNAKTTFVPAKGGVYREGFVLTTRLLSINPIYASQSNVERDIIEVMFDGLMRLDENGNLISNIAKNYNSEDNKVFDVVLRDDVFWSDGKKLTADDVVFTVKIAQNSDFQSTLRQQWEGVEVEKVSNYQVRFILENSSTVFKENLTLKPIPKHIFSDYGPREFRDSVYNMRPVSSGPYRFSDIKETTEGNVEFLKLERNPYYFRNTPYLNEVHFYFYRNKEELLLAAERSDVDGFAVYESFRKDFPYDDINGFHLYTASLPRYFSAIFNLQLEGITQEKEVRRALHYATNKEEILENVFQGKGEVLNSPLLPYFYNKEEYEEVESDYDIEKARDILVEAGFEDGKRESEDVFVFEKDLKENSQGEAVRNLQRCLIYLSEEDEDIYPEGEVTGFYGEETKKAVIYFQEKYREDILDPHDFKSGTGMVAGSTNDKLNELCGDLFEETISLELTITTAEDPLLLATAEELKRQWEELGIVISVNAENSLSLREEIIRPRNFEVLLFGTMLTGVINPLPLWHSQEIDDPGLNLSGYQNEEVDELLEEIIKDKEKKKDNLAKVEEIILDDLPVIFLFSPHFTYFVRENFKGVKERPLANSSLRFQDIDKWHVNTKRVF